MSVIHSERTFIGFARSRDKRISAGLLDGGTGMVEAIATQREQVSSFRCAKKLRSFGRQLNTFVLSPKAVMATPALDAPTYCKSVMRLFISCHAGSSRRATFVPLKCDLSRLVASNTASSGVFKLGA